jgi:hypothetical protein
MRSRVKLAAVTFWMTSQQPPRRWHQCRKDKEGLSRTRLGEVHGSFQGRLRAGLDISFGFEY